ncbi:MAG TPA: hypothetical protein GX390_03640 [Acholeplasmataceae bacterium]|jgi:hypothetical protein|nr:hypothetical protein [Acholeplasmataceae bacterium]
MFLVAFWQQALIIAGVVIVFLIVSYLNAKTKPKKPVDLPEKCQFCPSKTCVLKITDVEKKREELTEYLKQCEDEDESEKN